MGTPEFPAIFEEHAAFVWRTLRVMGIPEALIDDAVQEVFLIVHAKLQEFEARSSLRTWICAITYRTGANVRRKTRRRPEVPMLEEPSIRSVDNPETDTQASQSAEFVKTFCSTLNEGMRDVFVLCLLEECPTAEVGTLLGLSPNTVSSRVRLLRESFRKALTEHYQLKDDL